MMLTSKARTALVLVPMVLLVPAVGSASSASISGSVPKLVASGCRASSQRTPRTHFCDDFSSGRADQWNPEGGIWTATDGRYAATGNSDTRSACGHPTNQSLIKNFRARDLEVTLDMTSIARVDKFLVLRATDSDNQIELNFRAERPGAFPADLIVQEKSACRFVLHTPEFSVLIPAHQVGQAVHVRARLTGTRLRVWIDAVPILDRKFPFSARAGNVGVGVVEAGAAAFDNFEARAIP